MYFSNFNSDNFNYNFSNSLNYKYLIDQGLHLGGHKINYNIKNSSIIYGKRKNFLILNIIKNFIQFNKTLKLIELITFKRGTIYFIQNNNNLKFDSLLVRNPGVHLLKKANKPKYFGLLAFFNKWTPGFLTNNKIFFDQLKKKLSFPNLPHFGIIGDHNLNKYILKEFLKTNIPTSSCLDIYSENSELSVYNLIFNSHSQVSLILYF